MTINGETRLDESDRVRLWRIWVRCLSTPAPPPPGCLSELLVSSVFCELVTAKLGSDSVTLASSSVESLSLLLLSLLRVGSRVEISRDAVRIVSSIVPTTSVWASDRTDDERNSADAEVVESLAGLRVDIAASSLVFRCKLDTENGEGVREGWASTPVLVADSLRARSAASSKLGVISSVYVMDAVGGVPDAVELSVGEREGLASDSVDVSVSVWTVPLLFWESVLEPVGVQKLLWVADGLLEGERDSRGVIVASSVAVAPFFEREMVRLGPESVGKRV